MLHRILKTYSKGMGDLFLNFYDSQMYSEPSAIIATSPIAFFYSKNNIHRVDGLDFEPKNKQAIDALRETYLYVRDLAAKNKHKFIASGFLGFDLCRQLENISISAWDDLCVPDVYFAFYSDFQIVPNESITESVLRGNNNFNRAGFLKKNFPVTSNFSKKEYIVAINKAKEHIFDGDIFQVNLSQRFAADIDKIKPFELYERLMYSNFAPFSGYFDCGDFQILSSSPECFLNLKEGFVRTMPIKGTRQRSANPRIDAKLANELIHSNKDRAENVMIVDVERNDLSRVCEYHTISTDEICKLESFSNVHHLISAISGRLQGNKDIFDLFKAAFPSGSVTGAPKIRAMEIIYELEKLFRGPYTGCLGFIDADGNAVFNILIRTIILKDKKAYIQVGGGIVADSDPLKEYEETLHKASGMFKALGLK